MVLKILSTCLEYKLQKKQFFLFLSRIFSNFERKFFRLLPENVKNLSKLPTTCPEEQFVAWIFFKFWIVSDFLQKPLARFSKFYLRVQIENCGKKLFFLFSFQNFFDFWAKLFQTFGQFFKKLWKLPSACPQEQLVASKFFKTFWTVLDFLQKPLAWFSKIYLSVQSKHCWKNSLFLFSFQNFFGFWANIFQTFCQKTSKSFQN